MRSCTRIRYRLTCKLCGGTFWVRPYRLNSAQFCSAHCRQIGNARFNADKIGNTMRYRGEGKTYVKFHGRHLHRVVAEQKLGRRLRKGEIVHHKDRNKRNNLPFNLDVTTQSKHIGLHREELNRARAA